jgi:hypothetical protein
MNLRIKNEMNLRVKKIGWHEYTANGEIEVFKRGLNGV